jgi:hypothetical protein
MVPHEQVRAAKSFTSPKQPSFNGTKKLRSGPERPEEG